MRLAQTAILGAAFWSAAAAPAAAYIDPTAAGALMQSLYVVFAGAVVTVAAVPHKIAELARGLKARLTGKQAQPGGVPDQET